MTMSETATPSLNVPQSVLDAIGKHAIACYPEEACGLLVGAAATNAVLEFHPTENVARSARVYTINPKQHMVIDRDAEDRGL